MIAAAILKSLRWTRLFTSLFSQSYSEANEDNIVAYLSIDLHIYYMQKKCLPF